ncbi:hypothetical protein Q5P01_000983 [Channa striata]|uniref:Uncharacterized protein n=1 Tax=Channa striata TaxID=64152 RepID=A0AA88LFG4_CHASR|nr:hypothetical protein Q5P01_000983 [Channa striata]
MLETHAAESAQASRPRSRRGTTTTVERRRATSFIRASGGWQTDAGERGERGGFWPKEGDRIEFGAAPPVAERNSWKERGEQEDERKKTATAVVTVSPRYGSSRETCLLAKHLYHVDATKMDCLHCLGFSQEHRGTYRMMLGRERYERGFMALPTPCSALRRYTVFDTAPKCIVVRVRHPHLSLAVSSTGPPTRLQGYDEGASWTLDTFEKYSRGRCKRTERRGLLLKLAQRRVIYKWQ